LANIGLGQRGAVLILYAVGVVSGLLALLVCGISVRPALILALVLALAALTVVAILERFPYDRQDVPGNAA
jgi:hypothetical protein